MITYVNPHTGKLETPEEMGARPADSETVLPVSRAKSWEEAMKTARPVTVEELLKAKRVYRTAFLPLFGKVPEPVTPPGA